MCVCICLIFRGHLLVLVSAFTCNMDSHSKKSFFREAFLIMITGIEQNTFLQRFVLFFFQILLNRKKTAEKSNARSTETHTHSHAVSVRLYCRPHDDKPICGKIRVWSHELHSIYEKPEPFLHIFNALPRTKQKPEKKTIFCMCVVFFIWCENFRAFFSLER